METKTEMRPLFDGPIVKRAVIDALIKLDPRQQLKNPVMFVVAVGAVMTSGLLIRDIITGILKSLMFGLLIAAIACYRGLNVRGGAAGVGTATTSSVVTAITTVIGVDTLYNVIYVVFFP